MIEKALSSETRELNCVSSTISLLPECSSVNSTWFLGFEVSASYTLVRRKNAVEPCVKYGKSAMVPAMNISTATFHRTVFPYPFYRRNGGAGQRGAGQQDPGQQGAGQQDPGQQGAANIPRQILSQKQEKGAIDVLSVRLPPPKATRVDARAAASGLNRSDYVRARLLSDQPIANANRRRFSATERGQNPRYA